MKKKIPLSVLESLTSIIKDDRKLIQVEDRGDCLLSIVETDKSSMFYFKIRTSELASDGKSVIYNLDFSPRAKDFTEAWKGGIFANQFEEFFSGWFKIIVNYNKPHLLFNDPILEAYYNELESDFELVDEDAHFVPFKFPQQEQVINIYETIIKLIIAEKDEENETEATVILQEIEVAKKQLPKSTKKEAVNMLRKVFALCKKYSYSVAKAISTEVLVEIGKTLLIG